MALALPRAHDLTMQQIYDGNDVHLKIFVFEYVTGGGLYREPLPVTLAHEGGLMLQSLLDDLSGLAGVKLLTTRDSRLPSRVSALESIQVTPEANFENIWDHCLARADAIWLIAPETGGVLENLSSSVLASGKRLLGCTPAAVNVTASKFTTSRVLASRAVNVVPSLRPDAGFPDDGIWVVKPDDGAGCTDTCLFCSNAAMMTWLMQSGRMDTHIVQPWLQGTSASLSMLCRDGQAWLLSCNRQLIALEQDKFSYQGSVLNGMADNWQAFDVVAQRVAAAIPGLAGYVGVDLMVHDGAITVLEINPRLTTSYIGLRRAMGCNPAALVLDLFYNDRFELPRSMSRNIVEITLE